MVSRLDNYMYPLFCLAVAAVLFVGWRLRTEELITAEHGVGHMLGIVGTSMMAVLAVYPARKRLPALRVLGSVKMWFCIHMILGVLGPVCILFHAAFSFGSLNSSVALSLMLVIAVSGIVGRYVYCKIHDGLYGHRMTLIELSEKLNRKREEIESQLALVPGVKEELLKIAQGAAQACLSLAGSVRRLLTIRCRIPFVLSRIKRMTRAHLKEQAGGGGWITSIRTKKRNLWNLQAELFLAQTLSVVQFTFYERLFALWQVLHIPSSCLLALVVLVHIIAVSLY